MPDSLPALLDLIDRADAADGWNVRSPATIDLIDTCLGKPLVDRLVAAGLTPRLADHGHESRPDPDAQFILQEVLELPEPLFPTVNNFVAKSHEATEPNVMAYLGFTISHRWRHSARYEHGAHIRWGFALEAKEARYDQARPVLEGRTLAERIARCGGAPAMQLLSKRPLTGINPRGQTPGLWLTYFGRCFDAQAVRALGSVATIIERAAKDLEVLHRALSSEPL
jgi:hypothetical protein